MPTTASGAAVAWPREVQLKYDGPAPLTWIVVALLTLGGGLAIGGLYYHAEGIHAVSLLILGGGSVFLLAAMLFSTAIWPTSRMVYMGISLFGLGLMATGFGILHMN